MYSLKLCLQKSYSNPVNNNELFFFYANEESFIFQKLRSPLYCNQILVLCSINIVLSHLERKCSCMKHGVPQILFNIDLVRKVHFFNILNVDLAKNDCFNFLETFL